MKVRSINYLLTLLLENIERTSGEGLMKENGLCIQTARLMDTGIITTIEGNKLDTYLDLNLPEILPYSRYCWEQYKFAPRRKWLKTHIRLTKE